MKKVILISNYLFKYRVKVYNYFHEKFLESGYDFQVICSGGQDLNNTKFKYQIFAYKNIFERIKMYKYLNEYSPDVIINFLHLKDFMLFSLNLYGKLFKKPVIYWNHGIDLQDKTNKFKNTLYKAIHKISSAIILYSPNELKYINKKNHYKTFIANNTLNFEDESKMNLDGIDKVKEEYGIKEDNIILFVGRIQKRKNLDFILDNPIKIHNTAVVIVGDGIEKSQIEKISQLNNYYYLGAIYDDKKIAALFKSAKVFTIPGAIGLAINQAFYWGVPVVLLNSSHGPEIMYLENGINGFLVDDFNDYLNKINYLISDEEAWNRFHIACKNTMDTKGHINSMFNGFLSAMRFCENKLQ